MTSNDTEQSSDDFVVRVARVEVHIHVDDIADFIEWEEGWDLEAKALFDLRNHVGFGPMSYFIEWEDS